MDKPTPRMTGSLEKAAREMRELWGADAERVARQRGSHLVASWQSIRNAIGVVRGETADAVVDTAELYDG